VPTLVENSLGIAWDYLEATGELGNPGTAANHLLNTIETMIRLASAIDCSFPTKPSRPTNDLEWNRDCPYSGRNKALVMTNANVAHMLWTRPSRTGDAGERGKEIGKRPSSRHRFVSYRKAPERTSRLCARVNYMCALLRLQSSSTS
jgi:hypothetical protein